MNNEKLVSDEIQSEIEYDFRKIKDWIKHALNMGFLNADSWFHFNAFQVHLKLTKRFFNTYWYNTIEISNFYICDNFRRGKGRFTHFIKEIEDIANYNEITVIIENVVEPKLIQFLKRNKYYRIDNSTTFYKSDFRHD